MRAAAAASAGAAGLRERAPQRRLAQRDAIDGAPAEKAVDALADHIGEMLDLDRGRALDAQHQRAGLALSPAAARVHWIFIGSLCAAISAPTISLQRVTSSAEAKPCRVNVSPTTLPTRSRSGLA